MKSDGVMGEVMAWTMVVGYVGLIVWMLVGAGMCIMHNV
jgi:hypothetical protein